MRLSINYLQVHLIQIFTITSLAFSLLLFVGCAPIGPDYQSPQAQVNEIWSAGQAEAFANQATDENLNWWTHFNDPVLGSLIQTAYEQNLSLLTAGLRIMEARARLALVRGNSYPQLQEMNGNLTQIGATNAAPERYYTSAAVGFDAAWEMDFWGKFRRSIESADAALLADIASYDDILVTLTAEVARTYINIRTLEERLRLAEKNAKIQQDALKLIVYQFEAGTVTKLDILQGETLLSATLSTIPSLNNSLQQSRNGLAILLGKPPGELKGLINGPASIPAISSQIAIGVPSDLLRRRPDVRNAEMQTAAQSALVGVALAELYPSFTLFGSLGWNTTNSGDNDLNNIFDSDNYSYSFGPSFKWNLFHYDRIKNQVRIQDARLQQFITTYQDTVLNAAREVENSMAALVYTQEEAEYLRKGVSSSKESMELSMLQYQEGLIDYQRVLDPTRALTQKQDQYAQIKGRMATNAIAMFKALGGGWEMRIGNEYIPEKVRETMEERTDWGDLLQGSGP